MRNFYFFIASLLFFTAKMNAQFGCDAAIAITDGYTATNITTPGNGGVEDWNENPSNSCSNSSASYWDDDVYLFEYTAGVNVEEISMTIDSRNAWNGVGIFTTCTGMDLDDCIVSSSSTTAGTRTVETTLNANQTVYIAVGQWGPPNDLDFDVVEFSVSTCPRPTDIIVSNISDVSAEINWMAGSSETNWEYVVQVAGTGGPMGSGTTTTSTSVNTMSLTIDTDYEVYVRADCGSADFSEWVGPVNFSTRNASPPVNDECTNAIALTVNADLGCMNFISATNHGATTSPQPDDSVGTPNYDVWFSFVATATQHRISLENIVAQVGTSTDMAMAVYDDIAGCNMTATNLVGDSDPNILDINNLTIGNTYYVRVYGFSFAETNFDICLGTLPNPPVNDECDNAIALTVNNDFNCGMVTSGTTVSATASPQPHDATGTPNNDVWFTFVATSEEHIISILNKVTVIGTSVDMGMSVFDDMAGCNMTATNEVGESDPDNLNLTELTIGNTYYIRVYGWASSETSTAQINFDICIGTPPPPPTNDDCVNAITIMESANDGSCNNSISGTTVSATASSEDDCSTTNSDVWYTFVASESNNYIFSVTETQDFGFSSTYVSVFEGSCGGLIQVGTTCFSSTTEQTLTAGTTYYINVRSTSSTTGVNFDLCVYPAPPPPANDDCSGAISLTVGSEYSENPVDGTVLSALDTDEPTNEDCGDNGPGVWYTLTVPAMSPGSTLTIESGPDAATGNTGFDSVIDVFNGNCSTLTSIGCDDDGAATGNFSQVNLIEGTDITEGDVLYIRIWEYGGNEEEPFSISAYTTGLLSVSESEVVKKTLNIYPNPTKDLLNIDIDQEIESVVIFHSNGKRIVEIEKKKQIDVSSFLNGVYFIQVKTTDGQFFRKKFIKE